MVEDYDFIVIVTRFRNLIVILLLWKIFRRHVPVFSTRIEKGLHMVTPLIYWYLFIDRVQDFCISHAILVSHVVLLSLTALASLIWPAVFGA